MFFENAGAVGGRLVASDGEGNLICINPRFNPENLSVAPVSATRVIIPEKHLSGVTMVANFDVNGDGEVNVDDVCEVETQVAIGADLCKPAGTGDPVAGPCLPYPEGECSATADVNRDAYVDQRDVELMERRVGLPCGPPPVSP
jgi:hypothetical protein